jgi:hypothetical protein
MTTELEDSSLLIASNNFLASVDFPTPGAPDMATINRLPPPQSAAEIILRDSFETSDVMVSLCKMMIDLCGAVMAYYSKFVWLARMSSALMFKRVVSFKTMISNKMNNAPSYKDPMGKMDIL